MVPTRSQAVLAGIAAGAIGGAVSLLFMMLASLADQDPWWRYPNVLGTAFYGAAALRAGPSLATLGGAGLQIVISGIVGALFALAFARWFRTRRLTLIGAVAGLAWMYVAGSITGRFARLIPLYTPTAAGVAAYLLFGLCLGLARWFLPHTPAPAAVETPVTHTGEEAPIEPVPGETPGEEPAQTKSDPQQPL